MFNRYSVSITSVGSAQVEGTVDVPYRGTVTRVYAEVTAGTGTPVPTVQLGRVTAAVDSDVILTAQGHTTVLDYAPAAIAYRLPDDAGALYYRTLFVRASTSDATADHTVAVVIEIDAPDQVH